CRPTVLRSVNPVHRTGTVPPTRTCPRTSRTTSSTTARPEARTTSVAEGAEDTTPFSVTLVPCDRGAHPPRWAPPFVRPVPVGAGPGTPVHCGWGPVPLFRHRVIAALAQRGTIPRGVPNNPASNRRRPITALPGS